MEDNHFPLLSSPLLSSSLLPSTLLFLQTSKHSINACIRLNYTFFSLLRVDKQKHLGIALSYIAVPTLLKPNQFFLLQGLVTLVLLN